ncbi:MAG: DUF389 domain-containing protein [Fluviicola sp. XM-24bin1]|nr:MAG: DUF389 domain-containing protein [Fluviicola sp. XM-24bin1]
MREDSWLASVFKFLRLTHEEEDPQVIHDTIEKGIVFRGTNLWILVFAILVASVGLNMNSPAVIIGAMLISPLMGPINGVGYSVATYNFELLRRSLKNLAFAASTGLVASTIYFFVTPVHGEYSELLARTSPTIYDVMIATFGGLAGIVAISSKNKGNVIPGVAIATALMPPLCTAGFGIASGNLNYFAGAMFLFLINSVFIALSAMVVSQLLKLPKKSFLLSREIKNKNIVVGIVVAVTVLPSVYLGITLVQKEKFQEAAEKYVARVGVWEGNYLLKSDINAEERKIVLTYAGNEIDKDSESKLIERAGDFGMEDYKVIVKQGLKLSDQGLIQRSNEQLSAKENEINRLRAALLNEEKAADSIRMLPKKGEYLLNEIRSIYPQLQSCSYATTLEYVDSLDKPRSADIVYFEVSDSLTSEEQYKIRRWLIHRLKSDRLILKF